MKIMQLTNMRCVANAIKASQLKYRIAVLFMVKHSLHVRAAIARNTKACKFTRKMLTKYPHINILSDGFHYLKLTFWIETERFQELSRSTGCLHQNLKIGQMT